MVAVTHVLRPRALCMHKICIECAWDVYAEFMRFLTRRISEKGGAASLTSGQLIKDIRCKRA